MMDVQAYLNAIHTKLSCSKIIVSIESTTSRYLLNQGYFRARLRLVNQDFLEISESFQVNDEQIITLDYRYQWMDSSKQLLRKRWDSVKHFPELPNFPHHIHMGEEGTVKPGQSRNIIDFIEFLESELNR